MDNQEIKKDENVVAEETKVENESTTPELPSEKKVEEAQAPAEQPVEMPAPAETPAPVETPAPAETPAEPAQPAQVIDASNQPIAMMASESVAEEAAKQAQETAPAEASTEEVAPKKKEYTEEEKKQSRQNAFNSDERLLYEIKPDKQGNPLVVLIFFLLIFGFIFLLPTISKKYNEFFGQKVIRTNTPANTTQPTNPDGTKKTEFYKLNGSNFRVAIGDLEMINFVKSEKKGEYFIAFTIQNVSDKIYQYDNKYYISIYKDEQLLYRALLHTYDPLPPKGADEISLIISEKAYKEGNQFKMEEINPSQYPTAKINEKSGEYQVLTCTYRYDEMKYYFIDNKLLKIEEKYLQASNTSDYDQYKADIQTLSSKLKTIEGIDSTFIERDSEFEMVNSVELKTTSDSNLASLQLYRLFKYNESKDVVKFEIEAQGYKCS